MTESNNTIATFEQAAAQLTATHEAGHTIDYQKHFDAHAHVGAEGFELSGYFTRKDLESLLLLVKLARK
jgi:hypothetical protein